MERKNILVELDKVKRLVENKINKVGSFSPFMITFSFTTGGHIIQLPRWHDESEKAEILTELIEVATNNLPYAFIFASPTTRLQYQTQEDYDNNRDEKAERIPSIIIVGKTYEKSYHLHIDYEIADNKFVFSEHLDDVTNDNEPYWLDKIFQKVN